MGITRSMPAILTILAFLTPSLGDEGQKRGADAAPAAARGEPIQIERNVSIRLDREKLARFGVTAQEVADAIERHAEGGKAPLDASSLANVVVTTRDKRSIRLSDVAEIHLRRDPGRTGPDALNAAEAKFDEALKRSLRPRPKGGILSFRISPNRIEKGQDNARPTLKDTEIKRLTDELHKNGPAAGRTRGEEYQWFEFRGKADPELIVESYRSRTYVLLYARAPYIMIPCSEGENAWGLSEVYRTTDAHGQSAPGMSLDPKGAQLLGELTGANVRNRLAILIGDTVLSAPRIQMKVSDSAVITGSFTEQQVNDLLLGLRTGVAPKWLKGPTTQPDHRPNGKAQPSSESAAPRTPPPTD